jgi:DNA-binding MarR family transcriptional regulator
LWYSNKTMPNRQTSSTQGQPGESTAVEGIIDALGDLADVLRPHVQACAARIGLAPPYAIALRQIEGSSPMKDLAQRLRCDPSYVTTVADALEEHHYATREGDGRDRRVKNLVLTPAAFRAQNQFRRDLATDTPGIRQLEPADRTRLIEILRSMVTAEERPASGREA